MTVESSKSTLPAANLPTASQPSETAFNNQQIDLFQAFLCNSEDEKARLSNALDLWDSIPRYSVSRQAMGKMRTGKGFLELLKVDFNYKGMKLKAIIQPARIEGPDGSAQDYYPGANEELVEDALRKIAAEQRHGYFDKPNLRSGVVFTLHMLRKELARRGHTRSYQQIMLSLNILSGSVIELRAADGGSNPDAFSRSPYFPFLAAASRQKLAEDPDAKWVAQFHPLVTQSIDTIAYRQFNYQQMMSLPTQLARWLHKQLAVKFTFAGMLANPFEIRYSTIKRDSALLNRARERDNIRDVEEALGQLTRSGLLREVQKERITSDKGKIVDAVYRLLPSADFVREVKTANKRLQNQSKP